MHRNFRKTSQILTIFAFFLLFSACQSTSHPKNNGETVTNNVSTFEARKILGKWQSLKNADVSIELTESRMFSYVSGTKLSDESLIIYNDCIAKCLPVGMEPMPCFVTDGKRAENCFKVLELTDTNLTYALIGNSNKVLQFKRME